MSKYGNKYSGNSFEEWYQKHYGKVYDGISTDLSKDGTDMSDEDLAIGKQLLSNYQNKKKIESDFKTSQDTLLNNYSSAKGELNENKRVSEQNASVTYEKLKKYLPQQLKAQGLDGLGVSESALLEAYNTYSNTMGNIGAQHSKDISDLERAYKENMATLKAQERDMLYNADRDENGNLLVDNVINKYAQMKAEEDEKIADDKRANEEARYKIEAKNIEVMYQDMIGDDGKISEDDYNKLYAYVNGDQKSGEESNLKLYVGESNLGLLNSQLNGYKVMIRDKEAQEAINREKVGFTPIIPEAGFEIVGGNSSANGNKGDNFEIKYNGAPYKVEKGYNASEKTKELLSNAYRDKNNKEPEIGSVMVYGDKIFMYLHNNTNGGDTWSIIQGRALNQDSFIDLCNALKIRAYGRNSREENK